MSKGEITMAIRRFYPGGWTDQDLEDLRNELWTGFHSLRSPLLPAGGFTEKMLPGIFGEFRVDVSEHEDEVIVVADLPGLEKQDVSLRLINPRSLEISTERKDVTEEEKKGYYVRERIYGAMRRIIPLPNEVTEKNAKASFTNGVLEIRFKKVKEQKGGKIEIE
ncbi:MAG TPA: Hsp20/alpha crystallin family protein [Methanoregulaceae archaeon]|nr:Hsp20/alpha crystallin family protein [Methanoregulaceae archaeon]